MQAEKYLLKNNNWNWIFSSYDTLLSRSITSLAVTITMSRSQASDPPTDTEQDSTLNDSDEEGWEDAEVDGEDVSIVCLFCTETFPSSEGVFEHCAVVHGFEYKAVRKELGCSPFRS